MKTNILIKERNKAALKLLALRHEQKQLETENGRVASTLCPLSQEITALDKKYEWLKQQCEIVESQTVN